MNPDHVAHKWGHQFGLALGPLFEPGEIQQSGEHYVLLDGGYGTFVLSASEDELWRVADTGAWVWSSDIPHHVTVTPSKVGVLRWDRAHDPRVFERNSVEQSLDRFYDFLTQDRLRSNRSVVDHLLGFFRRIRSLVNYANIPDGRTTDVFVAALSDMIASGGRAHVTRGTGVEDEAIELFRKLDPTGLAAAREQIVRGPGPLSLFDLHPTLAVRHASGQLFQEAHFELLRAPASLDLFGLIGNPDVKITGRGGTHYTPPALARTIVEQALSILGSNLSSRGELSICDPACGSGAFLYEALRALRRLNFEGRLRIIGQDISIAAISMAKFVLSRALTDWSPKAGAELIFHVGDSLGELGIPRSDVIVMNPPFIGFGDQTGEQREQIRLAIGAVGGARGDLSMAFVLRALEALKTGGALGTLFPASLLSLKAAAPWRERLSASGQIHLLASIGDFGLFAHALVQVGAAIIGKPKIPANAEVLALVTQNDPKATGDALRFLRKRKPLPPVTPVLEENWSLFSVSASTLSTRATWRFPTPDKERMLRLLEDGQLSTVKALFKVRQGIQTGLNEAFLLTEQEWRDLPTRERSFFKAATMSDSIQNACVVQPYYLFFPYTSSGPRFRKEQELKAAVPTYFRKFLEANSSRLMNRAAIRRSGRSDWWGLMHERAWSVRKEPRIISKFFGAQGAFVNDHDARYLPVMGHAWFPTASLLETGGPGLTIREVLAAYTALLNSSAFVELLSVYAPHVAGGQFDISSRYVDAIPLPNLPLLSLDPDRGRLVSGLAQQGRNIDLADEAWTLRTERFVTHLYGGQVLTPV